MARTSYKVFETYYPYFVTCSVVDWLSIFSISGVAQIILDSLKFHQQHRGLTLYAYVVMEDHIHLVIQSDYLEKNMRTFKSFTARQIIDLLKTRGNDFYLHKLRDLKLSHHKGSEFQCWQEGYHPKQIISDKMMIQKIEYVHNNPVQRGYVDNPRDWIHSSACDYQGQKGMIPITKFKK